MVPGDELQITVRARPPVLGKARTSGANARRAAVNKRRPRGKSRAEMLPKRSSRFTWSALTLAAIAGWLTAAAGCGSPIEFDSLRLLRDRDAPMPGHATVRIIGRATNRTRRFLADIVVREMVEDRSGNRSVAGTNCALFLYLEPGESAYFSTDDFMVDASFLDRHARPRVEFVYGEDLEPREQAERLLTLRRQLHVEELRVAEYRAGGAVVRARVTNESGVAIEEVRGMLVVFDAAGGLLQVEPFSSRFEDSAAPIAKFVSSDAPDEPVRIVARLDYVKWRR